MARHDRIFQGPCSCIGHPAEEHDNTGCTHVAGAGTKGEHHCQCRAHWITLAPAPASLADRDPAIQEAMRWLISNPNLPEGRPAEVAKLFWDAACGLLQLVSDGPQLKGAIRRLTEAKDAAIRQAVADGES